MALLATSRLHFSSDATPLFRDREANIIKHLLNVMLGHLFRIISDFDLL